MVIGRLAGVAVRIVLYPPGPAAAPAAPAAPAEHTEKGRRLFTVAINSVHKCPSLLFNRLLVEFRKMSHFRGRT